MPSTLTNARYGVITTLNDEGLLEALRVSGLAVEDARRIREIPDGQRFRDGRYSGIDDLFYLSSRLLTTICAVDCAPAEPMPNTKAVTARMAANNRTRSTRGQVALPRILAFDLLSASA